MATKQFLSLPIIPKTGTKGLDFVKYLLITPPRSQAKFHQLVNFFQRQFLKSNSSPISHTNLQTEKEKKKGTFAYVYPANTQFPIAKTQTTLWGRYSGKNVGGMAVQAQE